MDTALGQFYTDHNIGRIIANSFESQCPSILLELGAGRGNLIKAVKEKWADIRVISTDIDNNNHLHIKESYPKDHHIHSDVANDELHSYLSQENLSIDIAICNPPYISLNLNEKILDIFEQAGFGRKFPDSTKIAADLVFLAQNLRLLRYGGELGIILPDSFMSGHNYEWVRETLVYNHCISMVIELPDGAFLGTEAKTHILMLKKEAPTAGAIKIVKISACGQIQDQLMVPSNLAIKRMDYSYHNWRKRHSKLKSQNDLNSLGAEIKRGNLSRKECITREIDHFHTTSFKDTVGGRVYFPSQKVDSKTVVAKKGDILVARVGKRCIGNVCIVADGMRPITDCVYRIRVPKKYQKQIFHSLISESGQDWLKAHSHGVCARVISKKDLLTYNVAL